MLTAARFPLWSGLALLGAATPLAAQDSIPRRPARDSAEVRTLAPLTIVGRSDDLIGLAASASEGHVGSADLRLRPITREGELQETVPGMIVTQHSGDGKANQYFVRGFNLDHGTDFQTSVEGMPVNMPTHAHGQGYTDLNFLVPELVGHIDYQLGLYHAGVGDFGSAGAAQYFLVPALEHPFVTVTAGQNGMARLAAGGAPRLGRGNLLVGGEAKHYNGPWEIGEDLQKVSGLARYTWESGPSRFSALVMAYHNQWNASDQIPLRAVGIGPVSRLGQIDPTDGGNTHRYSFSVSWRHSAMTSVQEVQLFAIRSDLSLFSDFQYRLSDTTRGDQFNQRENRTVLGGRLIQLHQLQTGGTEHVLTIGLQARYDILGPVGLYHTQARVRLGTVRQDDVNELGSGVFLEAESRWRPWFRTVLGLRGDVCTFHTASDLPANSGHRSAGIASPKASLVFTPSPRVEFYLSGGLGFHSNDARGTTIRVDPVTGQPVQAVDPLVRSRGAEVGMRFTPLRRWTSTLSLWALDLNSELLFTGDGGTTEPAAASRRRGLSWANFYRPIPHLALDADVSISRARFSGVPSGQDHIPGALEDVVSAGVTWSAATRGPYGSIRLRHFGSYPLLEDNSVRATPTSLVNAEVGYLFTRVRLQLSVLNLANSVADDIEYFYSSRLPGEPAAGVDDIHFHPVEPRQVRISFAWGL